MNLEELRKYKPQIEQIANKYGVKSIRVFGSVARGEANEESDVDFLVEFEGKINALDFGEFYNELECVVKNKIDLVIKDNLHWYVKQSILGESKEL